MKQIEPFDPDKFPQSSVDFIIKNAPVRNLNKMEVLTTMRFLYLKATLTDDCYNQIVVHCKDERLALCDDNDRFLALLADCDKRYVILGTKRCCRLFGGTVYHWRKIAHKCPITDVASALSEFGSGYYGRGWVIAPHIETLIDWMTTEDISPEVQKLLNI